MVRLPVSRGEDPDPSRSVSRCSAYGRYQRGSQDRWRPAEEGGLEEVLVAAICAEAEQRNILVSSFNHALLRRLHRRAPQLALGALYMPVRDVGKRPSALERRLGVSVFICSRSQLRRRLVRNAHHHDLTVIVYGVNTARHLGRVRRYGVDGIITDFPEKMVRWQRALASGFSQHS